VFVVVLLCIAVVEGEGGVGAAECVGGRLLSIFAVIVAIY
jgi:hypothetical protein